MNKIISILICLIFTISISYGQELLTNGDFEAGSIASWTVTNSGSGDFELHPPDGSVFLCGSIDVPNATGGSFHVVSNQLGPGTHGITQSFTTPTCLSTITLTYDYYINNTTGTEIINPAGLDETVFPNQHSRIDILTAGAAPFSTAPADIVTNILLSGVSVIPYSTSNTFDLTPFLTPGTTYQIRFAEVDNQGCYAMGVDNVSIFADVCCEAEGGSFNGE